MKTAWKGFTNVAFTTDPATGVTYTSYHDLFTVGAGYLDIAAAVANTDKATRLGLVAERRFLRAIPSRSTSAIRQG